MVQTARGGSAIYPDQTVVVQWDNGTRTNYRAGYMGKYDLRIIDNAQIGKEIYMNDVKCVKIIDQQVFVVC